jgi:hypothetical protein
MRITIPKEREREIEKQPATASTTVWEDLDDDIPY